MNVAIVTPEIQATSGGGHTFESEVFQAFLDLHKESRHQFFLTNIGSPPEGLADGSSLPRISVPYPRLRRAAANLAEKAARPFCKLTGLPAYRWQDSAFYPELASHKIDLICYNNPFQRLALDIPYLTPVWDLQHRLQPFFPEVGSHLEWGNRESHYRAFLQRAAGIVTGTQAGKREIGLFYGIDSSRIHLLPHPTPHFALQAAEKSRSPVKTPGIESEFVFYPAQFWPHKNHANLLLALDHLQKTSGWSPQLVLTGSDQGNLAHIRNLLRDLDSRLRVKILGFVDRPELNALYQHALALVYPSFFGPENLPPLEAFALGCPVIAANVPGSEEQLADAALRADPTKPNAWAEAIQALHSNPSLRAELIAKGQTRAKRFTSADYVRGLFKIMDEFEAVRRCWPTGQNKAS
jgi:glycosyltransferase involved in cell wall biosynthesis